MDIQHWRDWASLQDESYGHRGKGWTDGRLCGDLSGGWHLNNGCISDEIKDSQAGRAGPDVGHRMACIITGTSAGVSVEDDMMDGATLCTGCHSSTVTLVGPQRHLAPAVSGPRAQEASSGGSPSDLMVGKRQI